MRIFSSEHRYGSTPDEWPFLDTTVGYWVSSNSHSQVHLVGNPVIWRTGVVAIGLYLVLMLLYVIVFHRGWVKHPEASIACEAPTSESLSHDNNDVIEEIEENVAGDSDANDDEHGDSLQELPSSLDGSGSASAPPSAVDDAAPANNDHWWATFQRGGWLLVAGYLLHFIPYFVYDHTLFLHHYIPALYFKILALAFVVDHVGGSFVCGRWRILQHALTLAVVVWLGFVAFTFKTLAPLSYGDGNLTVSQLKELQINDNWDFVMH